jgi:hypothetical protein
VDQLDRCKCAIGDSKTYDVWNRQAGCVRLLLMGLLELDCYVLHVKANVIYDLVA